MSSQHQIDINQKNVRHRVRRQIISTSSDSWVNSGFILHQTTCLMIPSASVTHSLAVCKFLQKTACGALQSFKRVYV